MSRRKRPVIGTDFVIDSEGRAQFTRDYLIKKGFCCEHECRFCPYHDHTKPIATASPTLVSATQLVSARYGG